MKTFEFRVKPVTRWVVTEYMDDPESGAGHHICYGEYDHEDYAKKVRDALAAQKNSPGPPPSGE